MEANIKNIKPDVIHIHNIFPLWTFSILDAFNEKIFQLL